MDVKPQPGKNEGIEEAKSSEVSQDEGKATHQSN